MTRTLTIDAGSATVTALAYDTSRNRPIPIPKLILAHGAGADQRSPFMVAFATGLASLGIDVVTFNFAYSEQRRKVPDRGAALEACYTAVVDAIVAENHGPTSGLFIGGKSMGGRIATQIAASDHARPIAGLVLLGYPLHPPGRPAERRDRHLKDVRRPMLFVQGSRDNFGTPAELNETTTALSPAPTLHVVEGGDHSFKVARTNPAKQSAIYEDVQRIIASWVENVISDRTSGH